MYPVLVEFDCCGWPMVIGAYTTGIVAAGLIFLGGGWAIARRRGLPGGRVCLCLAAVLVAALVGARGLHWALHPNLYSRSPELLWRLGAGRFALQGAVLAALATGLLGCRLLRIDVFRLADATAPAIALGILASRIGCFLHGCCFGTETDLPWGVTFPAGSPAHLHLASGSLVQFFHPPPAVHPTQLYEALAALAAAGLALALLRRPCVSGVPFLAAATLLAGFQGINSFLRAPMAPPSMLDAAYPLLHVAFMFAGGTALIWRCRMPGFRGAVGP